MFLPVMYLLCSSYVHNRYTTSNILKIPLYEGAFKLVGRWCYGLARYFAKALVKTSS